MLEEMGYNILDVRRPIRINNVDVSEVDAIVERDGQRYAVEIKAGRIDVNGIRQAYVNALLLGLKPLVVAKGFSDDSAAELARELGVEVIQLSDQYIVDAEELEIVVREAVEDVLVEALTPLLAPLNVGEEDLEILKLITESPTIMELSSKLGVKINEAAKLIERLRSNGVIPARMKDYRRIRLYAMLVLLGMNLRKCITK